MMAKHSSSHWTLRSRGNPGFVSARTLQQNGPLLTLCMARPVGMSPSSQNIALGHIESFRPFLHLIPTEAADNGAASTEVPLPFPGEALLFLF